MKSTVSRAALAATLTLLVSLVLANQPQSSVLAAGLASIGVNFTANTWPMGPADEPGIVPGANWNNVDFGTGTDVPLSDSTGAATTAQLSFFSADNGSGAGYNGFAATNTPNLATNLLYMGGIFGNNDLGEISIQVTNIPYRIYDVYVYASPDTSATNLLSITNGTTTFYYRSGGQANWAADSLLETTSTDPFNPTVGPGQYQVFRRMATGSFSLATDGSMSFVLSNNVFGLQIVKGSAEACKQGGWTGITGLTFKNQGDCVQYVNTGK